MRVLLGNDESVSVTIRAACVDDADAVGEVHVRAWQSAYRGVMPDGYLDGLRSEDHAGRWRDHLLAPSSDARLFVVGEDLRVVGFAAVGSALDSDLSSEVGQLYAMNLDPGVWGRGLGRMLLDFATERLGTSGFCEAVLWVVPDNRRARRLYESAGWSDDGLGREDEVFGVVVPQMRYRRRLVPLPSRQTIP